MKLLSLLLIVSLYGCNKNTNYKSILVEGDSTYWDLYNRNHVKIESYLFKKNGECFRYYYTKQDSLFQYPDFDVVVPDTWKIIKNTIIIRGYQREILYLESDSMILLNPKMNDTLTFKKK